MTHAKALYLAPLKQDHFYLWLSRRYLIPDLLPVVAYDIQSALLHHLPSDKVGMAAASHCCCIVLTALW